MLGFNGSVIHREEKKNHQKKKEKNQNVMACMLLCHVVFGKPA
jgi:hypothetical protein